MAERIKDELGIEYNPAELPISICHSAAGYYVGQMEPCGLPYSRLSDYYRTPEEAKLGMISGWAVRLNLENDALIQALAEAGRIALFGTAGGSLLARVYTVAEKSPQ